MTDTYGRTCMCGYKEHDDNDPAFAPIYFNSKDAYIAESGEEPNAYVCPKCKMMQMK